MKRQITRRLTKQKTVILEELKKLKTHPTADSLFRRVRKRIPSISFGTVYRNLNLLKDTREILELTCGKYSSHYDGDTRNHHHFFCLKCQEILDMDGPVIKNLDETASKKSGMTVKYHRLDFYGYCKDCKY